MKDTFHKHRFLNHVITFSKEQTDMVGQLMLLLLFSHHKNRTTNQYAMQ